MRTLIDLIITGLRGLYASVLGKAEEQATILTDNLRTAAFCLLAIQPAMVVLARIGYGLESPGLISFGEFMITVSGILAAVVLTRFFIRGNIINYGAAAGSEVAGSVFKSLDVYNLKDAQKVDYYIRAIFATVVGGSLYCALFPVYVSLGLYALVILMVFFLAYSSGWLTSSKWLPKIMSASVGIAGVTLILILPFYFVSTRHAPEFLQGLLSYKNVAVEKAKTTTEVNTLDNKTREEVRKRLAELSGKRDGLMKRYPNISETEQKELQQYNSQIAKIQNEEYLNQEKPAQIEEPANPLLWFATFWLYFLIAGAVMLLFSATRGVGAAAIAAGIILLLITSIIPPIGKAIEAERAAAAENGSRTAIPSNSRFKAVQIAPDEWELTIPADIQWVDTGLNVTGKQVSIQYKSGCWKNHPTSTCSTGSGLGTFKDQQALLVPAAPLSALVGKTNSGTFPIGDSYSGSPGDGTLQLSLNDLGGYFRDNSGNLVLRAKIS